MLGHKMDFTTRLTYNCAHLRWTKESLGAKKSDLAKFLAISDHFLRIFFVNFFLTPHTPLLHDDRGDGGEGFDRVTRETRVTGASKDVEGGGEAEEGVRRRRRRRRKRCHHSGTDEQRTRKDRDAKPMQWTMEG